MRSVHAILYQGQEFSVETKIEIEKVQQALSELLKENDKNQGAHMIKDERRKLGSRHLYVSRYWVQKCITSITRPNQ